MRAALVGLLIILAGCADAPVAEPEEELQLDEELAATADTGIIRGVVVDVSITPIEGVRITFEDIEVFSNEAGAFGIADVRPGMACLNFERIGYVPVQSCTTVEAGVDEPPIVRVQMEADASSLPSVEPYFFRGMVKCGLSYIAACGLGGEDIGDSFMYTQQVAAGAQYITMEAVWEGTQPTGGNFQLRLGHTPAGPDTVDATATGPSPQQARVNKTIIQEAGIGAGNDLVGRMFVWEMEGTNIQQHTGQCVPVVLTTWCHGPGVAIEQEFEIFTHVFYGYEPGEDWRFTEAEPPTPPS